MTKEQAIEVLRCNTNLGYGIVIENESTQLIKEAIEMAIESLEQNTVSQETYDSEYLARKRAEQKLYEIEQNTCEDCVDRNHVIATISQHHFDKDKDNFDLLIHNLCKEINELPPVTPTHGTCKDCQYLLRDSSCFCCRISYRRMTNENFYCGNYEKREGEVIEMTREIWEERKNLPIDGKTDF